MRNYLLNEVFKDNNGVVLFVFSINEDGERTYHVANEPVKGFLYCFNSKIYELVDNDVASNLGKLELALNDRINVELFGKIFSNELVWIETDRVVEHAKPTEKSMVVERRVGEIFREPEIGETLVCVERPAGADICMRGNSWCAYDGHKDCYTTVCNKGSRKDGKGVRFEKVSEPKEGMLFRTDNNWFRLSLHNIRDCSNAHESNLINNILFGRTLSNEWSWDRVIEDMDMAEKRTLRIGPPRYEVNTVYFCVVEQSHRCEKFSQNGNQFIASNGYMLCSSNHPMIGHSGDDRRWCYVRGCDCGHDFTVMSMPIDEYDAFVVAVEEYNDSNGKSKMSKDDMDKKSTQSRLLPKLTLETLAERKIEWPKWAAYAVVSSAEYAYFYDERGEAHQEIPGKWDASDWPNSKIMNPEHEKAGFEVDINHSVRGRKFHAGDKVRIIDETSKNKGRMAIVDSGYYVSPGKIRINFCKDVSAIYNENQLELVEKADPSKLPDWLAVGELVYDDTLGYGRIIENIDGCIIKIRFLRDSMTVFREKLWMKQARIRPWDFKTAPFSFKVESVGGGVVFWLRGNGYNDENGYHYNFDEVAKYFDQIDRSPCGICEHLTDEGNWLE